MEDWNNFFGSKLNTILLLVLIILLAFVLKIMLNDKETFFSSLLSQDEIKKIDEEQRKLVEGTNRSLILGNKDDLISFSISPGAKVRGAVSYNGVIKGGYFFEANIGIAVADINKKVILQDHANATTDWMTVGPVSFEGKIDFSSLPKGSAYLTIQNDNPSGNRELDKFIFIPIVIE